MMMACLPFFPLSSLSPPKKHNKKPTKKNTKKSHKQSYDPDYTPNHSDDGARYTYSAQPGICLWNLERLAEAWAPLGLAGSRALRELAASYDAEFER